jgi:RNA polymerase sigma-70 factor (ECF subfamily)
MNERAAAEDVLQQTFLKLHGARGSYVEGEDPIPWLYAIARRTCVDELRRRNRACVRLVLRDDGELPEAEATFSGGRAADDAVEPYVEAEQTAALDALACLPDDHRTALVLTKLQGLSMSDAAAIVGTTEGALKVRAHRGYRRLRAILGEQELFADRLPGTAADGRRGRGSREACLA